MFLELRNLTVGYKTPLISGVDTGLGLGEICLLIGNNGVGKTTLIKTLLNQIPVLEGEVLLEAKNIKTLSNKEIAEHIAVVFSKSEIPANYTLTDLVSLGKFIHYPYYFELSQDDKNHVAEIIKDLNLKQFEHFPLHKLSDGNLQKAFIGRALAQNAPLIILDEPTTHLDEKNKIIILKLLRNLAKKYQKLILFSSHDWRLAKEFADKIWLIYGGQLEAGITEEILLKHDELLNPQLFNFAEGFVPPHIIAPTLEKEMLYSFLQKNCTKDISELSFIFSGEFWEVNSADSHYIFNSFGEMVELVAKPH